MLVGGCCSFLWYYYCLFGVVVGAGVDAGYPGELCVSSSETDLCVVVIGRRQQ